LAANGKEAVDAIAAGSEFKLILMEVQMSEVSGYGAATGFPPRWLGAAKGVCGTAGSPSSKWA
jgi:hypothetical protein